MIDIWKPLKHWHVTGAFGNSPKFYEKYGQKGHNGIDLRAPIGTPVYAADDGVVLFEGWGKDFGWMGAIAGISIVLKHGWGHTGYAHLSNTVIDNGQKVKRGQLIGHSGATGSVTGSHLHFEVLPLKPDFRNGFAGRVNPSNIVNLRDYGWTAPTVSKPASKPAAKPKTIAQLAQEVLDKKHGNGEARKKSLGKQYPTVQKEVNRLVEQRRLETLAEEVWDGLHGNGAERKKKLGKDYAKVQAIVNKGRK